MQFPFENKDERQNNQSVSEVKKNKRRHNIKANTSSEIARATLISMIGFFLAKVTGFLREVLVVPKLGFGMFSDPYYVAFYIPDLLYALLMGGSVSAAITPTLSSGIEQNREKEAWNSVNIFVSVSMVVMLVVLLIVAIIMPWLLPAANPAKAPEIIEAAIPISRILLIQSIFMTLISLTQGVLTAYKRFGLAAFGVMIYNIIYMLVLIFLGEQSFQGLRNVAWGVVGAAFIYFVFQLVLSRREISRFRFNFDYKNPGFKRLLKLAIPTLLSSSVLHVNSLVMNAFTNQFVGASTAIRHAEQAFMLPYGIIAVAVGTVMLPNLTAFYSTRNFKKVRSLYTSSLRRALFLIAPIATIFFTMNFETIQLIFQWDPTSYTDNDVAIVGNILQWFCFSLMFQTIIYMTNQAFYARRVTRIVLFNGIVTLILNPIFCVVFTQIFDFGINGIAMAHASYSLISATIVYFLYNVHNPKAKPYRILPFLLKLTYCMVVSGLVLAAINTIPIYSYNKLVQILLYLVKALVAIVVFYIAGISINFKETRDIQKKIWQITGKIKRQENQHAR